MLFSGAVQREYVEGLVSDWNDGHARSAEGINNYNCGGQPDATDWNSVHPGIGNHQPRHCVDVDRCCGHDE
ncbi:MAG: hypothetical protein QF363_07330 [Planctomycetaceae bacterium]|mgnify:CR=1 FL=1|nr:hypothetical protein [Planctomycetaceae bacterium]